jgi:CRISPR-associated protein Cst2
MPYPPYVRLSARVFVETSVLTGSGSIANYNAHAVATVIFRRGAGSPKVYEVPVISGNAIKHWHALYLAETYEALGGIYLNDLCRKGIGARGYDVNAKIGGKNLQRSGSEEEAIKDLCNDIHGFLNPGQQIKRESLVKVSFGIPILEEEVLEVASKYSVTHNRVIPVKNIEETMMIYKQEYSSVLYGFSMSMNLGMTLIPMYSGGSVSGISNIDNERRLRVKASLLALLPLLQGSASKQARALPISRVEELLIVLSELPVPNIINAAYPDYIERSIELVKGYVLSVSTSSKESKPGINTRILCYSRDHSRCDPHALSQISRDSTASKTEGKETDESKINGLISVKRYKDIGEMIKEAAEEASKMVKPLSGR